MIDTLAVAGYRSVRDLVIPVGPLTVITGANGSGKSNLYRALRLLAETAGGQVSASLAREGGLASVLWAGPEGFSRGMRRGEAPVQGGPRQGPVRLCLGFAGEGMGYAVDFGLPTPSQSLFTLDPQIKRECLWSGPVYRPATVQVDRNGPLVRSRGKRGAWQVIAKHLAAQDSMLTEVADPATAPEVLALRDRIRSWRFYDQFRADAAAPARRSQIGTRTPALSHDGGDLAAAWQTICEVGEVQLLQAAVEDAFPGAAVEVRAVDGRFSLLFHQEGLLRPLAQAELSDGTLRYLLWIAALLSPRPPALMVLNEPETSLHPDLLPALGRLIAQAATRAQVWVISHAPRLVAALERDPSCQSIVLEKTLGETDVPGIRELDRPPWQWPGR